MGIKEYEEIKVKVLAASGGRQSLADRLGISAPAISQWKKIPAERIGQVSAITGMRPEEIRPDLFNTAAA